MSKEDNMPDKVWMDYHLIGDNEEHKDEGYQSYIKQSLLDELRDVEKEFTNENIEAKGESELLFNAMVVIGNLIRRIDK